MRIGILTLPLHTNYGGILQAYALQTVLERMGHEVVHIEEYRKPIKLPLYKIVPVYAKRFCRFICNGFEGRLRLEKYQNDSYPVIGQYTHDFIAKHIAICTVASLTELQNCDFDCLIVGSDQIWKPSYFKNIEHAFLDFAFDWDVKRIAYAPSIGASVWQYTTHQTESCKKLIKKFDVVTVRESYSIKLVKENLGVTPQWAIDPTLLLSKEDYIELIKDTPQSKGNLLVYFLDMSNEKKAFVERLACEKHLTPFYVSANPEDYNLDIEYRIQPPVEKWLKGFDDAELVITDSFHACVFSTIFMKPFIVLGNTKRGQDRFYSLFETLSYDGNILTDVSEFDNKYINKLYDCNSLNQSRENSLNLLKSI